MDISDESVGKNIQRLRKAAGLSQAEVVAVMAERGVEGIYPQTFTRLEGGKRSLKFTEGVILADVLGVPPSALMATDENEAEFVGAILATDHASVALEAALSQAMQAVGKADEARAHLATVYKDSAKIAERESWGEALVSRWRAVERRAVGHLSETTEGLLAWGRPRLVAAADPYIEGGSDGVDPEAR